MPDFLIKLLRRPKLTLTGLLLGLGAFIGYSYWIQAALPQQMPLIIGKQLKEELTADAAEKYLHVSAPNSHPTAEESKEFEDTRLAIGQLQIDSLDKRGLGGMVVVKVKFHLADGKAPPDGQDTRYYRLRFNWINGWRFPYKVNEQQYLSAWFRVGF
ncbi:MAG TPA: hypothetical protein VK815_09125 [Candidatus Acidoferrales bacterium]|jgi:hypothetical protein|nr:hypothetical protein [Candidatus Acidoferrales bacterium]